jgi:hypothetical protein
MGVPLAKKSERGKKEKKTTFVLELPLVVEEGSAKRVRAHLEAARQLYNAILSEGQRRLRLMRADPAWQAARAIPHAQTIQDCALNSRSRKRDSKDTSSGMRIACLRSLIGMIRWSNMAWISLSNTRV